MDSEVFVFGFGFDRYGLTTPGVIEDDLFSILVHYSEAFGSSRHVLDLLLGEAFEPRGSWTIVGLGLSIGVGEQVVIKVGQNLQELGSGGQELISRGEVVPEDDFNGTARTDDSSLIREGFNEPFLLLG